MRALLLLVLGCGDAPKEASPAAEDTGLCATAPVVTYENFGQGFLIETCGTCHAAASPDRHGAPAEVVFDTEAQAIALADAILASATGPAPTMPPRGGVTDDDRLLLELWLTCGVD